MSEALQLKTPRLVLRRFTTGDADGLYDYLADETVLRYEPYDLPSRDDCVREAARRAGDPGFWAVCHAESGKLMGNVTLMPGEQDSWELGYVFGRTHWGQGYATEAARAVVDHAFAEKGAHRVTAMCNPENAPSWRLLERLGLRREGQLQRNVWFRRDEVGRPQWQDTWLYAVLRDEWGEPAGGGDGA